VRYARWLRELIRGSVDVQSRARRSYSAVVMPTDALLTFGMLKLTSLMMKLLRNSRGGQVLLVNQVFQEADPPNYVIMMLQADAACTNALDISRDGCCV
jgi:hypothetical protein